MINPENSKCAIFSSELQLRAAALGAASASSGLRWTHQEPGSVSVSHAAHEAAGQGEGWRRDVLFFFFKPGTRRGWGKLLVEWSVNRDSVVLG